MDCLFLDDDKDVQYSVRRYILLDTDNLMHDILAGNNTPTSYVAKSSAARDVLKSLFGL